MWAAAIVGTVYGLVEKAVLFNVIPVILGVFLPMHTLWQLNRGRQLFAFFEAKKAGDKRRAFKEMFLATFVIFLMHGCWDAVLDVIEYFANNKELQYGDVISVVGMIVLVSLGVVYAVFTVITTVKVAQRDRQALRFAEEADL